MGKYCLIDFESRDPCLLLDHLKLIMYQSLPRLPLCSSSVTFGALPSSSPCTMATHAPSGSSPNIQNLSLDQYDQSNHIDLTLDDDEPNSSVLNSDLKRPTTGYPSPLPRQTMFYDPVHSSENQQSYPKFSPSNHLPPSYHSPPMKPNIFSQLDQTSFISPPPQPPLYAPQSSNYRPVFAGPSQAPRNTSAQLPITGSARTLPPLVPSRPSSSAPPSNHQVIDLTDSPSPPPSPRPRQQPLYNPLPDDLHPKTPVCIGQLTVTALVIYPVSYLQAQDPNHEIEWANVRLQYDHNPQRGDATETIHIKTPSGKTPSGEFSQGEVFGVVEQKVATDLGPMLGKGLIRLDAKVRRGMPNVCLCSLFFYESLFRSFALSSFLSFHFRCWFILRRAILMWLAIICNNVVYCLITPLVHTTSRAS